YEAAKVDGANAWHRFRSITLPLLRPTLLFVAVVNTLGSLQVFDLAFVLTNGGPVNATNTVVLYMYQTAFNFTRMGRASAMAVMLTSTLASYGFAKFHFPCLDILFMLVLATMMIPFFVVLIPIFFLVRQLGWMDSYLGLIVPNIVTAFGIFLMRQYMLTLPDELLDAARIDGASELAIYWRIALPLAGPALGALAILAFVYHWNSFLWPLVVIRSRELATIPIGLNSLRVYASSPEVINLQMAGAALAIIPVVAVFAVLQRHFVRGIALTGIKG